MTEHDTKGVLAVLKVAYPAFYKDKSKQELTAVVNLWHRMFADDDAELVMAAVEAFIATDSKGFPPVIGAIKNKISELKRPDEMTEYEAWNLIKEAVSNGYYGAHEEFSKLPPILRRLIGSPNQLRTWAMMDSEHLHTVVASNFMRSYRVRASHERDYDMLPGSVKGFIGALSERMNMPGLPEGVGEYEVNERRNDIHRLLEEA